MSTAEQDEKEAREYIESVFDTTDEETEGELVLAYLAGISAERGRSKQAKEQGALELAEIVAKDKLRGPGWDEVEIQAEIDELMQLYHGVKP